MPTTQNPEFRIQNSALLRRQLARWFRTHARDLPWRRTRDPYAIMVSEFMLQQTQVVTVLDYYVRWLVRFPDFRTLAAASEDDVLHAWQGLGYYSRARNLHQAAKLVLERHGGQLPDSLAAIATLPGIGRYTAGAIASFAFDSATPIIDANIARVLARLLDLREPIDSARGAAILWETAEQLLPPRADNRARSGSAGGRLHNSALMELGALVCTPRRPRCTVCPIRSHCRTTDPESLPRKRPRRATVALEENCAWIVRDGALLLEQQPGPRWRGLWKLPPVFTSGPLRDARRSTQSESPQPLLTLDYAFTHHRVRLRIFKSAAPTPTSPSQRWIAFHELETIAIASPHRRAIRALALSA